MIEAGYARKKYGGKPMTKKPVRFFLFVFFASSLLIGGQSFEKAPPQNEQTETSWEMDSRSYQLGIIAAFSEIVAAGVKKLALSSPLAPEKMTELLPDAKRIATTNGALLYLEKDFCVTDLFPEDLTEGKYVLLIYLEPVKEQYLALKKEKEELIRAERYEGEARRNIARKMGRLLSYPEERIEKMLEKNER
jgi:hypothetical protein